MRLLVFCMTSLVMGSRMVRITPRTHPDFVVAIVPPKLGGKGTIKVISTREDRKVEESGKATFKISKGMTEISQGGSKICKNEKNDSIEVCTGEDELYSKWKLVSEDGGVRFRTENDVCLEAVEEKGKADPVRLIGKECKLNTKSQLFDLTFVDEENQDSDEVEFNKSSQKDLPLEDLLPYLLYGKEPIANQRIILYDGEGKKKASFKGSVSPLLIASLSSGILPHSNKVTSPYSSYRPLSGSKLEEEVAITPNYADYGKLY
ncbi:uncharacterized protein Eint_081970 [Encephalitozoon intestinalis ATCC 50506]|uniref:Uncharacterized protein n=1 Tax=Encephalitozoon intestinalis (strain ATCC 50506) TaxID=876142 RepID=E0S8C1_ENCIT|nr:uncharacterized protein Eint_081970 [Encephalitozoon intestinalis ATCC 50506]ADM12127.1 hypothetical protein Eint_081970 [Encephalitozoon intestinalis ATCC 50506]UTX46159.1 hypothetical protein GPK93_10g17530 [Encephalitozoon intestinalis]